MLARLRLLFAMSLLCLGAWFAALALEGYLPAGAKGTHTASSARRSASSDAQQFMSSLTREPQVKSQLNSRAKPQLEAKSPQVAGKVEKRRAASTAQLPWPLNLFMD